MFLIVAFQHMEATIDFVADVVQLRGLENKTQWEFHYAFADTSVSYVLQPHGFVGELYCQLRITQQGKQDTLYEEWIASTVSESSKPKHTRHLTGKRALLLSPGMYDVELLVRDMNNVKNERRDSSSSRVRPFGLQVEMSDVLFTLPRARDKDTAFIRNTVPASPNPRHEFIGTSPSVGVYFEIYNCALNDIDTVVVEYLILDNVDREAQTAFLKKQTPENGVVIRDDLPVGALRSGVYSFRVSIKSTDLDKTYAYQVDRIYILNPELPPEGQILISEEERFLASEWAVKTGEALDHQMDLAMVIAGPGERTIAKDLKDDRAKQRFLYRFWLIRDPIPGTEANERLDDFRKMYNYANTFYASALTREGWKTDRGITLLRYGMPTQVEQFIQTIDTKPYEIWFYQNIQGGAKFYFVDWQTIQNHKLVHSTAMGEIRDEKWFDRWARAFTPDLNPAESVTPQFR